MNFLKWLQGLSESTRPGQSFHPQAAYVAVSVLLPVTVGLFVGFTLRLVERVLGVELGRGAH